MRETFKKVLLATMLFSTILFLGFPSMNLAHANGNPEKAAAEEKAKADAALAAKEQAEKEAKEKADAAAKEQAEQTGDVAEPPSGPNVNREEVTETVDIETPASVTGQKIDGTGTVTDFSTSGSKAFYTITDTEQNVFYLIIDLDKTDNNVYFLSDINKSDLSAPAENATKVEQPAEQVQSANAEAPKEESGNGFLIAVLLIAVVGVAAYYFLVMRKRHNQKNEEDEENEEMNEDYEDDFYEDEQENKDNK